MSSVIFCAVSGGDPVFLAGERHARFGGKIVAVVFRQAALHGMRHHFLRRFAAGAAAPAQAEGGQRSGEKQGFHRFSFK